MRILHVNFEYGVSGGGAIAATRLHNMLLAAGIESFFACQRQTQSGKNIIVFPPIGSLRRKIHLFLSKVLRNMWKLIPGVRRKIDLNILPTGFNAVVREINPDIIQLHFFENDTVSYGEISRLKVPVLLTLHDFRYINGFDPYPLGDERFVEGFCFKNSIWIERLLWKKKRQMAEVSGLRFVGPSQWVATECRRSMIGRGKEVFSIPNLINSEYRYDASIQRDNSKNIILFGCNGGYLNQYKGFPELKEGLLCLDESEQKRTELHIFGSVGDDFYIGGVLVRLLGAIRDPVQLSKLYNMSDVFAFPSVTETQGMVKIEALLCGCPVVTFDRTACAEGVKHKYNGWVAADGNIKSFAEGLKWALGLKGAGEGKRCQIARSAMRQYGEDVLIKKWLSLYNHISAKR